MSPILVVMENEVEAFWCFAGAMERVVSVVSCAVKSYPVIYEHLVSRTGHFHIFL